MTTASVSPNPNGNGWNNSNVTVSLKATDNETTGGLGAQQITYTASGAQTLGNTVVSGASASIPITSEGITTITYFATDFAGNAEEPKSITVRLDKTPPTITGSSAPAANANGWNKTDVTVQFQCTDATSGLAAGSPPAPTVLSAEGANQSVSAVCTDIAGNSAAATVSGVNIDKTAPTLACSATPNVLWPPNHTLVPVNTSVNVSDSLSGADAFTLTSAVSNEPDGGSGDIQGFAIGAPSTTGQLRAERLGTGTGRIYTLTYTGTDRAGNSASCTTTVNVPHDQGQ